MSEQLPEEYEIIVYEAVVNGVLQEYLIIDHVTTTMGDLKTFRIKYLTTQHALVRRLN